MINLKFKSLEVEGFQSIGKASIDFDNLGTCLIIGKNNSDSKVRSNGSGKSSLIISLIWCLFGSTPNGIKSEVVNTFYNKGCSVFIDFYVDDVNYKIRRSIKHKEYKTGLLILKNDEDISAKNKKDSNEIIKEILNIDQDLFLQLIFLSQGFSNRFAIYTPKVRKELLESLYNINDDLNKFCEKIKIKESENKNKYLEINNNKVRFESNEQNINNNIIQFNNNINELKSKINELNNTNTNITQDELNTYLNDIEELRKQYEDVTSKKTNLQLKINNLKNDINNLKSKNYTSSSKINELKSNQKSNVCPTCGQIITNASEHNHNIDKQIKIIEIDINETNDVIINLNSKLDIMDKKLIGFNDIINTISNNINSLNNVYQTKLKEYNIQLEKEANVLSLKNQIKQFKDLVDSNTKSLNDCKIKLKEAEKELEKVIENLDVISNIIRLSGNQFKAYLLEDIINQLNIELEELSKSLFDNRIIKISCDNKLDILLDDKYYEQLSGGEQRKCDIGLIIAQRKLAQKMKSVSSNILIMDEIFDGLDDVSFNIVLDLLSDEMQDVEDNIIISHRNIEEIPFDHKIEVIKNENNISEVNFY